MEVGNLDLRLPADATRVDDTIDQDAAFAAWAAEMSTSHGLDADVTDAEEDPVLHTVRSLGIPDELAGSLAATVHACAVVTAGHTAPPPDGDSSLPAPDLRARASELLGAVEVLMTSGAVLDESLVSGTRQLTAANGRLLLAIKGTVSPDELSPTDRDRWRARSKSVTRGEIAAATGWGRDEVSDLVALANTPAAVTGPVRRALRAGEAPWRLARRFHRAAADLPHELAAEVANGMFGSDPAVAVSERLDSGGNFTGRPWSHREYYRALDREIAKARARAELQDPDRKKKSRAQLIAASDLWITMDPDGTASVGFRCSATQAAAIGERIEAAARRARAGGDKRPLNVLRATIATALLLHGTLVRPTTGTDQRADAPMGAEGDSPPSGQAKSPPPGQTDVPRGQDPGPPADDRPDPRPSLIDIEHSEQLDRILDGLPSATINILVPLTTLLPHLGQQLDAPASEQHGSAQNSPEDTAPSTGEDSVPSTPEDPAQVPAAPGPGVGEVIGKYPHFLSGAQIRELALTPGTSLFRILTDPVTGRYVERSSTAYQFDAAMRRNVIFADVTCRAPGCTVSAAQCQFDHVQEFGTPGGDTSEANAALLHGVDHQRKTEKLWDAIIHPNRDMTWTSMLGRIYRTKAHDYNQYTALLRATTAEVAAASADDFAEALDLAVYAAMSYRPAHDPLEAEDDDTEQETFPAWDLIGLRHLDAHGRRQWRPDPDVAEVERQRMAAARSHHQQPDGGESRVPASLTTDGQVQDDRRQEAPGNTDPDESPGTDPDESPGTLPDESPGTLPDESPGTLPDESRGTGQAGPQDIGQPESRDGGPWAGANDDPPPF